MFTSNGVEVPFDSDHFSPMTESTGLLSDATALRRRYQLDGYVYLKAVLDPALLRRLRAEYFGAFDPSYLDDSYPVSAGVFSGRRPPGLPAHGTPGHPAYDLVRGQTFAELADHRGLADLAEAVLGRPGQVLPRQIVRHFDRSVPRASRAHRDHRYLDEGSDHLLTMWIPLTDIPLATGGLLYLEDSDGLDGSTLDELRRVSDRPTDDRPVSHDLAWVAEQLGRRWRWTDFQAGDVVLHSPRVLHASLDTATDAMRLSADLRFLACGESPDPRWLAPWAGDDGY